MDNVYQNKDFTIEQLRNDICSEIFKNENKLLHHLLYFGSDLLEPADWKEVMTQIDEDTLPVDLVFVQLASNYFKKKFYLIPVNQPIENSTDININKDDLEKKFVTVIPNEKATGSPFYMLYFPQGDFGPQNYFQSVFIDHDAPSTSNQSWISHDLVNLNDILKASKKPNNCDDIDDEEESSDDGGHDSPPEPEQKKMKNKDKHANKTRSNTGNAYNEVTMIIPIDPTATVIVNKTEIPIKKKVNRKEKIYQIAPGEGKVRNNFMINNNNKHYEVWILQKA